MSFQEQVDRLNVWSRGDERAPHKPLLLLLILGRRSQGLSGEVAFAEIEEQLRSLLLEFGPPRKSQHPEYPFWRLQNDGIWEVVADLPLTTRESNTDIPVTELRLKNARGRLRQSILNELDANPRLLTDVAYGILDSHFPASLHEEIAATVGLTFRAGLKRRRDPSFRNKVLMAYEYSCAFCGLAVRLGDVNVGLEAAHIKWHQAHGPDTEENGLALCATHHKLFDFGALSLNETGVIVLSKQVNGAGEFDHRVLRHHGQPARAPQDPAHSPGSDYLAWHRKQVFKGPPRVL